MWQLGLEVAEERLDPGLVVGGGRAAEVLSDPGAGHEHRGGLGGHLRPVVGDGQQHRDAVVVVGDHPVGELFQQVALEQVLLSVGDQGTGERELDWVEVSSALTTVDSQYREMTSSTATTHRPAPR
ncbi:hypothetical protein BJF82_15405 [Kytococcus sp. CUA-901]|nr:hypothetical protein BJF82_15405 [Kytococcus sp. CUA-901]